MVRKGVRVSIRIDTLKRQQKYVRTMCKKCAVARNIGPVVPLLGNRRELLLGRCPAARYARLSGNMSGCPEICSEIGSAARKYARLPGMPGCPEICPAARLSEMSGMPGCPAVRNYARLPGNMPGIGTTTTDGRPTPAFSGTAGDFHRPARATVRHDATRSRPA